ncbi:capsular biosynthesis protein [Bacteroidota bacterium]
MIKETDVLVIDIDGTLCEEKIKDSKYLSLNPIEQNLKKLLDFRAKGFYIILHTSRQMRTFQGNLGRINAETAKDLFLWLDKHHIPYDEIHFGKPWCGYNGFYVDDKAIRPKEFRELSYDEIQAIIKRDK